MWPRLPRVAVGGGGGAQDLGPAAPGPRPWTLMVSGVSVGSSPSLCEPRDPAAEVEKGASPLRESLRAFPQLLSDLHRDDNLPSVGESAGHAGAPLVRLLALTNVLWEVEALGSPGAQDEIDADGFIPFL